MTKLAIVQAPQDYRDPLGSAFKASCYAEYSGFFQIGMVTRNDGDGAIKQEEYARRRRRRFDVGRNARDDGDGAFKQ
jgi:hypothetical protein